MSAPLRIERPQAQSAASFAVGGSSPQSGDTLNDYLGRLVKLIPAEGVSAYTIGSGIIPADQTLVLGIWTLVCAIIVFVLRWVTTSDSRAGLKPQITAVIITLIAFAIWIYTLGGIFAALNIWYSYIGSLFALAFTIIVPAVYKGD